MEATQRPPRNRQRDRMPLLKLQKVKSLILPKRQSFRRIDGRRHMRAISTRARLPDCLSIKAKTGIVRCSHEYQCCRENKVITFFGTIEDLKELVCAAYPKGGWLKGSLNIYEFREGGGKGRLIWYPQTGDITVTGKGRSKASFERALTALLEEYSNYKPVRSSDEVRRARRGTNCRIQDRF